MTVNGTGIVTKEEEEDGYFTCAVSVQHKKHDIETSSSYSATSDDQLGRKVIWPAASNQMKQTAEDSKIKTSSSGLDTKWIQQKTTDQQMTTNRISRSNSRSRNIMDRARSFERGETSSRPGSRLSSRPRSPSGNRADDNSWQTQMERPGSRTDVDSRRFGEIGRVSTSTWEERIRTGTSYETLPTRTPPPKRRGLGTKPADERPAVSTPEPPAPPVRTRYPAVKPESEFPPPPSDSSDSKGLSEESVGQLVEENKESIVKQWVESTNQSADNVAKELEKFAYDIAESVVSNMEKNTEKKEKTSSSSVQQLTTYKQEQMSSSSGINYSTPGSSGVYFAAPAKTSHRELHGPVYVQEDNRRVGLTFQQEERRREELRREEEAKQEEKRRMQADLEAKKLQKEMEERRLYEEHERKRAQEEEMRKLEIMRRQEEEIKRKEILMREEIERKRLEELRLQELEEKRIEEMKKQEILRFEQLKLEEEAKRNEEIRLEQEMRKQYELQQQAIREQQRKDAEEKARQEEYIRRQEQLKKEEQERYQAQLRLEEKARIEEQRRLEEIARQQEQAKLEERIRQEEQRKEEQKRREEKAKLEEIARLEEISKQEKIAKMEEQARREQQILEQEQKRRLEKSTQELNENVREHIPKLIKTKSFDHSQDQLHQSFKYEEHLGCVKTGQVNEKRNFWMRSTSESRINQAGLSPAPRRKRVDWSATRQDDSRPGSSLGQAVDTGSVRNITTGFLAKSKSTAAVMQEDQTRGRSKQRVVHHNGWSKQNQEEQSKHEFTDVKTNKVNETITAWGKRDSSNSGRSTPIPSRNIGEVFAENKVAKNAEQESNANSWRIKTPEPTLKLVNVSVEKAVGSEQNIHISENAHAQMANYIQEKKVLSTSQQETTESKINMDNSTTSQTFSMSVATDSVSQAPPPTPERNQSIGGKSQTSVSNSSTGNHFQLNTNSQLSSVFTSNQKKTPLPQSKQDQIQQTFLPHNLENSTSTHSINSVLSTCSSSALPVPVKQEWFDEDANSTSSVLQPGVLSPTQTGRTPLPVVANWFDNNATTDKQDIDPDTSNSLIETATNKILSESIKETCQKETKTLLNEMFDELVNEQNTKEMLEFSEDTATIKRKSSGNKTESVSEDMDKDVANIEETMTDKRNSDSPKTTNDSLCYVPQSPKDIRKKFKEASNFEKNFPKSTDLEFSPEFREGIKGKVKESTMAFLNQSAANSNNIENKGKEIEEIKCQRAISMGENNDDDFIDREVKLRQEKLQELEEIKKSRAQSSEVQQDVSLQNAYEAEKQERNFEIFQLPKKTFDSTPSFSSESKNLQMREERNKELAQLINRAKEPTIEDDVKTKALKEERAQELAALSERKFENIYETSQEKLSLLKEERRKELAELANRKVEVDWSSDSKEKSLREERARELSEITNNRVQGQISDEITVEKDDQLSSERIKELMQISEMRSNNNFETNFADNMEVETKTIGNYETATKPEVQNRVRSTAAVWREREKSGSQDSTKIPGEEKEMPTRRIGSLFRNDPDYWNLNENEPEIPQPPMHVDVTDNNSNSNPPPPPRQSSRNKMEEYGRDPGWNAPWRKS